MYRTWLKSCLFVSALIFVGIVYSFGQAVEICNDGKDNDGNGVIDCNDSFCNYPATVEKGCRCFDNVDNDGDGKIDAADTDCASFYGLTFVGSGSTCSITPPPGQAFSTIAAPQTSSQNTADTPAKVVVGDMNNDGMPDVVVTSKWNSTIQVVATTTIGGFKPGDVMGDFRTPGSKIFPKAGSNYVFEHEALIADIDKDKIGEMYAIASERGGSPNNKPVRFYLVGFKYAVKNLIPLFDAVDLGPDRPGSPGIADFDGDGKAEIYLRNQIYAAESGKLLANAGGNWDTQVNAGPVAANILGDNKLELICGPIIYSVPNMSARGLVALTVAKDMNTLGTTYYPKGYVDLTEFGTDQASTTSTADIDGDGFLDVLMTGAINCSGNEGVPCGNNITTIFYWNVQKNTVSTYAPPDPNPNGWTWGTGRINLGDANGDGKLEALFCAGSKLFCLGLDATGKLTLLWVRTINDSLSGILGLTVYDFNNDGKPEVVYRDSQELVIVDGLTGQTKIWS